MLILVVAVIVLLAVLGTGFLQVTRVQRLGVETYEGDIDTVRESILTEIRGTLRDDLLDDAGRLFNPDATVPGGADEPYDYVWTNPAVATDPANQRSATGLLTGTDYTGTIVGGENDDAWLASNQPDFTANRWPQITSLSGYYVGLDGSAGTAGDSNLEAASDITTGWDEFAVTGTAPNNVNSATGVDLAYTAALGPLVDTDGDGAGDARWEFPPIAQIGGVIYVAAVRIIDLSAMVNVETATGLVDATGAFDPFAEAPRWSHPSELDLGLFMSDPVFASVNAAWDAELDDLLSYRFSMGAAVGSPLVSRANRLALWEDQARRYGSLSTGTGGPIGPRADFGVSDELELRENNGLSDGVQSGELESRLPSFLRSAAMPADATARQLATNGQAAEFYGSVTGPETNPRVHLTVSSGAGVFAPRIDGVDPVDDPQFKLDVNLASTAELREAIFNAYNNGAAPTLPGIFASGGTAAGFADQFTACLIDYLDEDSELTEVSDSGTAYYGMERLPAVVEAYAQRRYESSVTASGDFDGDADDPDHEITWTAVGNTGYVIEVRNPWNRPIDLAGVQVQVLDSASTPAFTIDLGDGFAAAETASLGGPGDGLLGTDEVIVLFRHSNANTDADDEVDAALVTEETDFFYIRYPEQTGAWPAELDGTAAPAPTGGSGGLLLGTAEVRMLASTSMGTPLAYQAASARTLPDAYRERVDDQAAAPADTADYVEATTYNTTDGLASLLVEAGQWMENTGTAPNPLVPNPGRETDVDELGEAAKPTAPTPSPAPASTDQVILADGLMIHLGELATLSILAPTGPGAPTAPDATLAEVWSLVAATGGVDGYRLDFGFNGTGPVAFGPGNEAVPHAVLLLERLTLLSPQDDAIDNDPSVDDQDETFVPGLINLNTASEVVLRNVFPIPDATLRQTLADEVVAFREDETNRGGMVGSDPRPGIAYLGELAEALEDLLVAAPYGGDTDDIAGVEIDFLGDPDDGIGAGSGADGVGDDREERAQIMSWLYQTASTRSDVYAAYILIRGYPADDPSLGAIESQRVLAIFNRSGVTEPDSDVASRVFILE